MRFNAWCVVGDRHGSASLAHGSSAQSYKATQLALQKARRSLQHYDLYEGRTIYHDITCKYHTLKIQFTSKPPGNFTWII
jgi:ribosomal protein S5